MKRTLAVAAIAFACTQAQAETIPVAGVYAAGADMDPAIDTIAFEGFGGDSGPELSFMLDDLLGSAMIDGDPWFRIVPAATLGAISTNEAAEQDNPAPRIAIMRGSARSTFDDYAIDPKKVKKCVEKEDGKCVRRETIIFECRGLTVNYTPMLRLVAPDGALLFESSDQMQATREYCEDDHNMPDGNRMLSSLARQYALSIRHELAPRHQAENFRVIEKRNGLSKENARKFKASVRLTKSDPAAACLGFGDLEKANPEHHSILFNVGLCKESEGRLNEARHFYRRALSIAPGNSAVESGMARIASKLAAERQITMRYNSL